MLFERRLIALSYQGSSLHIARSVTPTCRSLQADQSIIRRNHNMAGAGSDLFDDLLSLEDNFYKEGYDAGLADGEYAGLVEGKMFGIEKGYEKALELGRLHGRGMIWQMRSQRPADEISASKSTNGSFADENAIIAQKKDSQLPKNSRLVKHVQALLASTDAKSLATDNSDEAVTDFDERIARAQAKAKVIAAIVGEPLTVDIGTTTTTGIEESRGLNARH